MVDQTRPASPSPPAGGAFGPNAWLVDDMYEEYRSDPSSVSESWREFFADYVPGGVATAAPCRRRRRRQRRAGRDQRPPAAADGAPAAATPAPRSAGRRPRRRRRRPAPSAAAGPRRPGRRRHRRRRPTRRSGAGAAAGGGGPDRRRTWRRRWRCPRPPACARCRPSCSRSTGPSSTSTWPGPRGRRSASPISSATPWCGRSRPCPRSTPPSSPDVDGTGKPGVVRHDHVGLGLAVDVEKSDGTRTLLVPVDRATPRLSTSGPSWSPTRTWCARSTPRRPTPDDFAGATVTLTNPGTLGTVQSVPRLMPGQGAIIGVGALGYPAEYPGGRPPQPGRASGSGPVVTLTSTYDHRIIQGAESGLFLTYMAECLTGRARLLRDGVRGHGRALRAGALAGRRQRR